jgi:hypothetical protein
MQSFINGISITLANCPFLEADSAGQLSAENTNKINRPTLSQMKGNKNDGLFVNAKIHNSCMKSYVPF